MDIPPVTVTFNSTEAVRALELLAQAALESPDLVKGIAKLEGPLFNSAAREGIHAADNGRVIEVAVFPTEKLRLFLRALGKIGNSLPENPAIHRPRE